MQLGVCDPQPCQFLEACLRSLIFCQNAYKLTYIRKPTNTEQWTLYRETEKLSRVEQILSFWKSLKKIKWKYWENWFPNMWVRQSWRSKSLQNKVYTLSDNLLSWKWVVSASALFCGWHQTANTITLFYLSVVGWITSWGFADRQVLK